MGWMDALTSLPVSLAYPSTLSLPAIPVLHNLARHSMPWPSETFQWQRQRRWAGDLVSGGEGDVFSSFAFLM